MARSLVTRLKIRVKRLVLSKGLSPRRIKSGIFRGQRMYLDLQSQTQLYLGLFERELYKHVARLARGINTAIDIGAAQGEYTLYFLGKTPARKVFAFEPSQEDRARLLANLKLNKLDRDSRLSLFSRFVGSDSRKECLLDSLIPDISAPCLIKIDVDGAEANILRGASELLRLNGIRWVIETHSKELEKTCIRILREAGCDVRIVPNARWRVIVPELRPGGQNRWLVAESRG